MSNNNNNNVFIALGALLIGIVGTQLYYTQIKTSDDYGYRTTSMNNVRGGHMMPDGNMMGGGTDMGSMMMDMTARMKGKTGAELEQIFLKDMIVHHQGAILMAQELQKGTKRPELQKMANDIIRVQTGEIEMMRNWLKEWFGLI
ncbi:MAG: DUF305 domain-containing protein [Minisyncoccia bacterium]